jgi:RHS repeat-associated protein
VATTYAYNAKNQLLNISTINNAGTTLVSFAYTLTPTGNRTKIVEHDGVTRNYAYDSLYRLTDEHVRQGTAPDAPTAWRNQFAYDPVGNRLEQLRQTENGTPQPVVYTYDERDRLLTENGISGPVTYGWDANGNQTAKSGTDGATYTWDIENRLVRVELAGGTVVVHTYDAHGTRVITATTPAGGSPKVVDYLVDTTGLSQVVAETHAGLLTTYYARGADLLAALRPEPADTSSLAARYLLAEGIGTVRAIADQGGTATDRYSVEAFGRQLAHVGEDANTYLMAGESVDPTVGLYYNRARWLDPAEGRFLSVDPFRGDTTDPRTLNHFGYAGAQPTLLVDPTGEFFDIGLGALMSVAMIGPISFRPFFGMNLISFAKLSGPKRAAISRASENVLGCSGEGDCGREIIGKLERSNFDFDLFKTYLRFGISAYDGTKTVARINGAVYPNVYSAREFLRPFKLPEDATVKQVFAATSTSGGRIQALTSLAFKSQLTTFFRPEAIGDDKTTFGLLFHEALHGFGAWMGASGFDDAGLKATLGIPLSKPSHEISVLIRQYCYR